MPIIVRKGTEVLRIDEAQLPEFQRQGFIPAPEGTQIGASFSDPITGERRMLDLPGQPLQFPTTPTVPISSSASAVKTPVTTINSDDAQARFDQAQRLITQQQSQLRNIQQQTETRIRAKGEEQKRLLGEQQREAKTTAETISFRLGRKDTPFGLDEARRLAETQTRELRLLDESIEDQISQANALYAKGEIGLAEQSIQAADKLFTQRLQLKQEQRAQEAVEIQRVREERETDVQRARELRETTRFKREEIEKQSEKAILSLIQFDDTGDIFVPSSEDLKKLSEKTGIDTISLNSTLTKQRIELMKVNREERKVKLDELKFENEIGGKLNEMLSVEEAIKLGVPQGTTRRQALGILPQEKLDFTSAKFILDLRKEFAMRDEVKQFFDIDRSYKGMVAARDQALQQGGNEKSKAAADQALITLYNKMLDPNSVVREGEYARSLQGQSALNRIMGWIERVATGGSGLTDPERSNMVSVAQVLYNNAKTTYDTTEKFFREEALVNGIDPSRIIRPVVNPMTANLQKDTTLDDIWR